MPLGLGVDTGGTFTDAAIVDMDSKKILAKAKSPTTYQDLAIGILGAIDGALQSSQISPAAIDLVGLSTTLATNSILEGKGGEVGLLGIGWTPQKDWVLGCKKAAFIGGGYDAWGMKSTSISEQELTAALEEVCKGVDAVAISGKFSVANPLQETNTKRLVTERYGLPVVLGHEMSGELGIYERTVTAVLNAQLMPVISSFLTSMEESLASRAITAPVYVFRGNGGLMSLDMAKEMPVETLLSGPAASLMGGHALSGKDSCLVVDMGGTSTDIAGLKNGFPRLNVEGAMVGQWRTRVNAIDIWTCGLGGDSNISLDDHGNIALGPDKVVPLAVAAEKYADLTSKMAAEHLLSFYIPARPAVANMTKKEQSVLRFVTEHAPCSLYEAIAQVEDVVFVEDELQRLKKRGFVSLTGLTPTDIMHCLGTYQAGNVEAAALGLQIFADKYGDEELDLKEEIMRLVIAKVGEEVIKKALADKNTAIKDDQAFATLLRAAAGVDLFRDLSLETHLKLPLVGVGAPAKLLIAPLAQQMDVELIVPEGHEVCNAVGAVLSRVVESVTVKIYPSSDYTYRVFSPGSSPIEYSTLEMAKSSAQTAAKHHVLDRIKCADVTDIQLNMEVTEHRFCDGYGKEMKFTNWVDVTATAVGKPKLKLSNSPKSR